jgi:hypothetical protein
LGQRVGRAAPAARLMLATADSPTPRPTVSGETISGRLPEIAPLVVVLIGCIILQRFALPVAGGAFGLSFVIGLSVAAWGLLRGIFVIEPARFVLFIVMVAALLLTRVVSDRPFSVLSLLMLLALYAPFILIMPLPHGAYRRLLLAFQTVAAVVAGCGIVQFAIQFIAGQAWMFPFDRLLPTSLFVPDFNLVIELGNGITKSTGFWLLEPSILSQLMAIAILIELRWFWRPAMLALFGTGIFLAFSGTGLLLLAALLPAVLIARGVMHWFVVLALAVIGVAWLLADTFPVSFFMGRLGEFGNTQSSGSMRFLGPYWATFDLFPGRPDLLVSGVGPGAAFDAVAHLDYGAHDASWFKLLVEYGLIGALPFAVFYGYCLFAGSPDCLLSAAFLFVVLFLGGYLLGFYLQFMILALLVWPRPAPPAPMRHAGAKTAGSPHA